MIDFDNTQEWQEVPKGAKLPHYKTKSHNYMTTEYNFYHLLDENGVYLAELAEPRHKGRARLYKSM